MPRFKKNQQKEIWLWSGVTVVMVAVLVSWISFLPKQLKVAASSDIEKELFTKSTDQLANLLTEQQQTGNNIKKFLGEEIKNLAASSTATSTLTDQQIKNLKNKIEKTNP